jgi:hypothetical protein
MLKSNLYPSLVTLITFYNETIKSLLELIGFIVLIYQKKILYVFPREL